MNNKINCFKIGSVVLSVQGLSEKALDGKEGYFRRFAVPECIPDIRLRYFLTRHIPGTDKETETAEDGSCRILRKGDQIWRWPAESGEKNKVCFVQKFSYGQRNHSDIFLDEKAFRTNPRLPVQAMGLDFLLAPRGYVILHASCVEYEEKAILFTAPSGTGKSTQAELWRSCRRGAEIINGDRIIAAFENRMPRVYGIPLCGNSGIVKNRELPIRAVVILGQAKENRITSLTGRDALSFILSESSIHAWDRVGTAGSLDTLLEIVRRVPVCRLDCRPDETAVRCLESWLRRQETDGQKSMGNGFPDQ